MYIGHGTITAFQILLSIGLIITRDEAISFCNWTEGIIPYHALPDGSKAIFHPGASALAVKWQCYGR